MGPGLVLGPSQGSGTGRKVLRKVWDGLGDPPKDLGRVGGPSWRSGTGWVTLPKVRDGSRVVQNRSGSPPEGQERVGRSSQGL